MVDLDDAGLLFVEGEVRLFDDDDGVAREDAILPKADIRMRQYSSATMATVQVRARMRSQKRRTMSFFLR